MPNFLSYNNANMKIITPFVNRATIIGVLNNNWIMKKDEGEDGNKPDTPDIPDNPDNPPVNPGDTDDTGETGEDNF